MKRKAFKHQNAMYISRKREQRLTKTCALLSTTFIVCWTPFVIMHIYRYVLILGQEKNGMLFRSRNKGETSSTFDTLFNIAVWLGWFNSAINPIIYYTNREVS